MGYELINRIEIKKDGVYLSSHSSNDDIPFHLWRCQTLSDVYAAEGQSGLDREIICMLYEYAQLRGKHKSLARYRYALESPTARTIYRHYTDLIDTRYESLDKEDQKRVWYKPTEKAREYLRYEQDMRGKMYAEIAGLCQEYESLHRSHDLER